jgi:hypothetical protein
VLIGIIASFVENNKNLVQFSSINLTKREKCMKLLNRVAAVSENFSTDEGEYTLTDGYWSVRVTDDKLVNELDKLLISEVNAQTNTTISVGDVVTVIGPEDSGHYGNWAEAMSEYIGGTYNVTEVFKSSVFDDFGMNECIYIDSDNEYWSWDPRWLVKQ